MYEIKDTGCTWNYHLRSGLIKRGWVQFPIDKRLFIKQGLIIILYADDECIIPHSKSQIKAEIKSLRQDYNLTNDGELEDSFGNRFECHSNGSITLTQPLVGLDSNDVHVKLHNCPALSVIHDNPNTKPRLQKWNYHSAVGCFSYIQKKST